LGEAAVDRGGVGELGGVEERGQVPGKQAGCIVWAGDPNAILDRDESALDHDPAAAPERVGCANSVGAISFGILPRIEPRPRVRVARNPDACSVSFTSDGRHGTLQVGVLRKAVARRVERPHDDVHARARVPEDG
jgi:hypothetical protein